MADDWKIDKSGSSFKDDEAMPSAGNEQAAYMRQIRQRNLEALHHESRRKDMT
ncbi:hypothetical protein FE257_005307 [Aspergillus nanangensis]|uniref:Uncharacterized protein n=1 Tax=Aspergillus nanangensis TaxID=2582783 RepID=A0AAD4CAA6_ASPNN|nr:hypothetical protein FE257_005307 [Aspergillus nanangensis]